MLCRPTNGPCDEAESCDGVNGACPTDGYIADGVQSTGGTCNPYLCDGHQTGCPNSCAGNGDCLQPATCQTNQCQ